MTRDVEPGYQGGGDVWSRALVGDNGREAGLLAMNEADKLKGSKDDLAYDPEETNGHFSYSLS